EMKQLEDDKIAEALELSFARGDDSQTLNAADDEEQTGQCDTESAVASSSKNPTECIVTDVIDEDLRDEGATGDSLKGDDTKDVRIRNLDLKLARLEKKNRELKKFTKTVAVDSNGKLKDIGSGI
ncbi:unnamed protein product, partial [Allacma fusca]